MRVVVTVPSKLDSFAANAVNTFKMADGFARIGHDVFLVCSRPDNPNFTFDDLKSRLSLSHRITVVPTSISPFNWRLYRDEWFALRADAETARLKPDVGYNRGFTLPSRMAKRGIPTIAEVHKISTRLRFRRMAKAAARFDSFRTFVTIAPEMGDHLVGLGAPARKILLLQTGVDLSLFNRPDDRPRQRVSSRRPNIVYSGQLLDYKGIPTILDAAELLPDCDFTLVGGLPRDIERHARNIEHRSLGNVRLLGPKPHAELPVILWDADVLLLPPSARHVSAQTTSPVKLGEYLAAGSPIVATRIPALDRLLSDREACLVAPDSGQALADGIRRVLADHDYAYGLALAAMARAQLIGYTDRARAIIDHAFGR